MHKLNFGFRYARNAEQRKPIKANVNVSSYAKTLAVEREQFIAESARQECSLSPLRVKRRSTEMANKMEFQYPKAGPGPKPIKMQPIWNRWQIEAPVVAGIGIGIGGITAEKFCSLGMDFPLLESKCYAWGWRSKNCKTLTGFSQPPTVAFRVLPIEFFLCFCARP